jgi:hypothetical protein
MLLSTFGPEKERGEGKNETGALVHIGPFYQRLEVGKGKSNV